EQEPAQHAAALSRPVPLALQAVQVPGVQADDRGADHAPAVRADGNMLQPLTGSLVGRTEPAGGDVPQVDLAEGAQHATNAQQVAAVGGEAQVQHAAAVACQLVQEIAAGHVPDLDPR